MAREQAKKGDGVLKPRKPLPRTGMKKNQGTTTPYQAKNNTIKNRSDAYSIF